MSGGMRVKMGSETSGQITLNEAIPDFFEKKDQIVSDYESWKDLNYDDLPFGQKKVIDEVIDPIVQAIDERNGEGIVKYAMDKQTKQLWNGIMGAQFQ